jgi:FkbM family methyltransferase
MLNDDSLNPNVNLRPDGTMIRPVDILSHELETLRSNYEDGCVSKLAYNASMWDLHQRLFEYSRFLKGTNVDAIEIDEHGVVFQLRDPEIKLRCTPGDQRHVAITSLNFRHYELQELSAVACLAKACNLIFDIGANTGFYSIALGQRFPHSKIVSFEPILSTYLELKSNLALNRVSNVTTHNLGLSDRSCNEVFYFDSSVPGATSAAPLGPEFGPTETFICPVETIDNFVERTGVAPDLIKCDVEGGELRVFRGATRMFDRFKPMVFTEMLRKWSARFGYHPNEIIAFFRERDYECFVLAEGMLQSFAEMAEDTVETNFFFLHRRKHLEMVRFLGLLK